MAEIVGYFDSTTEGIRAKNDREGYARIWQNVTKCPYCEGAFDEFQAKGLIDEAVIESEWPEGG